MKSRIKVTMIPNTVEPFVGGICVDDDSLLAVTELQVLAQQPSSVYLTSQRDAEIVRCIILGMRPKHLVLIPSTTMSCGEMCQRTPWKPRPLWYLLGRLIKQESPLSLTSWWRLSLTPFGLSSERWQVLSFKLITALSNILKKKKARSDVNPEQDYLLYQPQAAAWHISLSLWPQHLKTLKKFRRTFFVTRGRSGHALYYPTPSV